MYEALFDCCISKQLVQLSLWMFEWKWTCFTDCDGSQQRDLQSWWSIRESFFGTLLILCNEIKDMDSQTCRRVSRNVWRIVGTMFAGFAFFKVLLQLVCRTSSFWKFVIIYNNYVITDCL